MNLVSFCHPNRVFGNFANGAAFEAFAAATTVASQSVRESLVRRASSSNVEFCDEMKEISVLR